MRRRRTRAEGWVTGHDFPRDSIGPALTGRCKVLWQARIGVTVGMPFVQSDEIVCGMAGMAQHQAHRRLGTEGGVKAPAGDETAVAQAEHLDFALTVSLVPHGKGHAGNEDLPVAPI